MDYSATEQRHEVAAEQVGKMEVCNWMKVKAKGFLGNEEGSADQALRDVMPQKASKHMKHCCHLHHLTLRVQSMQHPLARGRRKMVKHPKGKTNK